MANDNELLIEARIISDLEENCTDLDISDDLYEKLQEQVGNVAKHIEDFLEEKQFCDEFRSFGLLNEVFIQGSAALGTTVKPIGKNEFDIDVVSNFQTRYVSDSKTPPPDCAPEDFTYILDWKKKFGDILKEYKGYSDDQVISKNRCWRIEPVGDYHFDFTPTASDKYKLPRQWIVDDTAKTCFETDPKGLIKEFKRIADGKRPNIIHLHKLLEIGKVYSAQIPYHTWGRGHLRRTIQLLKRHRDCFFNIKCNKNYAPISMVITVLTMKFYEEHCDNQTPFNNRLNMIVRIIQDMEEWFISGEEQRYWKVLNPMNYNENFADKWGHNSNYPDAFKEWIQKAFTDFSGLQKTTKGNTLLEASDSSQYLSFLSP